jgi:hypothetical protein
VLTIDEIKKHASQRIETLTGRLDAFAEAVAESPMRALDNCDADFQRTAELMEWRLLISSLEKHELDDVVKGRTLELVRRARRGTKSTSATSNLMNQYRLAALATILEEIGAITC